MDTELNTWILSLKSAASRLKLLPSHDALVILKHSLSIPKVLYILRTSHCADHPALTEFDQQLRISLSELLNVSLDDEQWMQASLPVKEVGLGIRSVHQVASSAPLTSVHGADNLISNIHPHRLLSLVDPSIEISMNTWRSMNDSMPPSGPSMTVQRNWNMGVISKTKSLLLPSAGDQIKSNEFPKRQVRGQDHIGDADRKSTRLNSSH